MNKIATAVFASTAIAALARPFNPNGGGWKIDANGAVELKDGNPVYVDAEGKEQTLSVTAISGLVGESKHLRKRAQEAEDKLAAFGDLDPTVAKDAVTKIKALGDNKLIEAGKVDEVKTQIEGQYKEQLNALTGERDTLAAQVNTMTLDLAFNASDFMNNRLAIPADIVRHALANNFKVENGKVVPYGNDGNPIYSKARIGEVASFDEAVELILSARPDKDKIIATNVNNGSGNNGGGGNGSGSRIMKRADFDALPAMEKGIYAAKMGAGELKIVD